MKNSNNNSYCLKIYFHVIRRSNGTGGQTTQSVSEAFNILNQDFNPHNISFNWDNQIDYIDNTTYYNNPNHGSTPTTPPTIFSINNHQDGIDIYLYDDSVGGSGLANGVGESSEFYVTGSYWKAPYNSFTKSHVISHEMGHVLYLWHTHHGTYDEGGNDNPCPELVNGSNSATCGDYVADTPADPHLKFNVNQSTCEWNSSGTDANGSPYNPDEKNVMSYTDVNCMDYFTEDQGERMRNAINTLSYLQQVVTDNCLVQELSSIERLCYNSSQTLSISNISSNSTTWQVSSNVKIISSSDNSITIKAKYSAPYGNGWVKATLSNGTTLQENFKIYGTFVDVNKITIKNTENHIPYILYTNGYIDMRGYWNHIIANYDGNVMNYPGYNWEFSFGSTVGYRTPIINAMRIFAFRGYGIRVKTRLSNPCGCSSWKEQQFQSRWTSRRYMGLPIFGY